MSELTFEQVVAKAMLAKCFNGVPVQSPAPDPLLSEHAFNILTKVADGCTTGAKANRHIGWAQAVICLRKGYSLDFMQGLNAACSALTPAPGEEG